MFSEAEIGQLFGQPYRHSTLLADWQRIEQLPLHAYEKISLFDLRHYLPQNLLHKIDIASMAFGLEVRVPFLDHHVVEYALTLPQSVKVQGNEQKVLLKQLLTTYLPADLVYRPKWGFPAPLGKWLGKELQPLVQEYLAPEKIRAQGIFNPRAVQQLCKEFERGKTYHYKRVWALLYFQMWYARYG